VVHRAKKVMGANHEVNTPKMTMGQCWLGKLSQYKLSNQPEMLSKSCYEIKKNKKKLMED